MATVREASRQAVERGLNGYGLTAAPLTPRRDVLDLLAELHPVTTDVPLVRLGPAGDGGYVVPDDVDGIIACFSPGIGAVSDFESDCAARGMDVFMADASVDGPAVANERFHFVKKYLGPVPDETTMEIDEWVEESLGGRAGDLLLQMDIEGAEWQVLPTMSDDLLRRCRIIVIELHDLHELFVRPAFWCMAPQLRRIVRTHHCVHIHPNNYLGTSTRNGVTIPRLAEITFLRRDRATVTGFARSFPHPLDADNTGRPVIALPTSLWRS